MAPYKDFAVLMFIIAGLLAGAIIFLRVRDRRTLLPEMSAAERHAALAHNIAQTYRWWHVAILAAVVNAMLLDRNWALLFDAAISAFFIFRYYYRKRSHEPGEPPSSGNSAPPIH